MERTNNKVYISWDDYQFFILKIAKQIKEFEGEGKFKYPLKGIITIPKGGLPMAVSLSHQLGNLPVYIFRHEDYAFNENEIFLIVDDIADTGQTLLSVLLNYGLSVKNTYCATLCYKPQSKIKPDFVGWNEQDHKHVVFPWETTSSPKVVLTEDGELKKKFD